MLEEHSLASSIVPRVIEALDAHGVDVWCYQGNDWLVRDLDAPHVAREAATVQFPPTLRAGYDDLADGVVKVVGVSDDADAIAAALDALRATFAGTRGSEHVAAVLPRRHAPRREQGGRDRLPRHRPRYRARGDRRRSATARTTS